MLGQLERARLARPGETLLGFDAASGGALADDVVRVVRALTDASDRQARLRAALAPASLTGLGSERSA